MKEENQENCPLVHQNHQPQDQINNNDTISCTTNTTNNNNNVICSINSCSNNNNKEQDRLLPIANVGRIMKKVIPGNGKISKDAKETVQECVSEFISFVTGEASDKCQREKRKTINGDDIIWAITTLGFEDYVAPLKVYLNKYREIEGEKLNVPKQQQDNNQIRSSSSLVTQSDHQIRQQQPQHHHHHHQQNNLNHHNNTTINVPNFNALCSANLLAAPPHHQPPFLPTDHTFSLPYSPRQFQQQDHIDSVAHW